MRHIDSHAIQTFGSVAIKTKYTFSYNLLKRLWKKVMFFSGTSSKEKVNLK